MVLSLLTLVLHRLCDHLVKVRDPLRHVRLTPGVKPPRSVRKVAQEAAFSPVSSTLLEYDKRIADSKFSC